MTDSPLLPFLPQTVPQFSQLGWFALLLILAVALGEIARLIRLPRLLGYVVAGIALGPRGTGLMHWATIIDLRMFVDVALGLMLFELGHWLDLSWLRRNPWLLATSLLEAALTFGAVFGALRLAGLSAMFAVGAATIAMSTSPAVVVQLSRELRAQGQVTERLKTLTALNSGYAVVGISIWTSWLHLEYEESVLSAALHPLYLLLGSLALAAVAALVARFLPRWLRDHPNTVLLLILGLVLLLIGGARALELSPLLVLLGFGALTRRWVGWVRVLPQGFGTVSSITAVVLFALIGASLDVPSVGRMAVLALALVAARLAAKWAAATVTALPAGISRKKGALLGLGLSPMSGLAVVLVQDISGLFPDFPADLAAIVLAAVSLLELIAPVITKVALTTAREVRME